MVTQSFKVKKKDFDRKPYTVFQHLLRTFLKCYTIRDIIIDDQNSMVVFKKSHKINGIKMQDPKEHTVRFEILESEDPKNMILKIII